MRQTKNFYEEAQCNLVHEIPMKTYPKLRYGTGLDVALLENGEFPEHRNIWELNTARMVRKV